MVNSFHFSEIAKIGAGQGAPQESSAFVGEGKPFIRAGSLESLCAGEALDTLEIINDESAKKHRMKLYPAGTVVFAKSGMSATKDRVFVLPNPAYIVSHLSTIDLNQELADPTFVRYFWKNYKPSRLIKDDSYPSINAEDIENVEIQLPSLTEQKRIASLLARADRLRQLRRTAHDLGDALLQSVFLEMFGDPLANPKHFQIELFGNLGDGKYGIVDGPFGSSVDTSVDYISDGEIPVIRSKNIRPLAFDESDLKFMSREKFKTVERSKVVPGDILLVKVGATIGDTCIFPDKFKEAVLSTTGSCRITPNKKLINPVFFLQQLYLLKPHLQKMSSEAVQPFLNMTTVKEIQLLLPPLSLQEEFAGVVGRVESLRGRMGESERQVERLFESLLSESFGEK